MSSDTAQKPEEPLQNPDPVKEYDPKDDELGCFKEGINDAMNRLPWLKTKVGDVQRMQSGETICFLQEFQTDTPVSVWAKRLSRKAFVVYGIIRTRYNILGGGLGVLGCPTSDEVPARDQIGRYNNFQNGAIYWAARTGAVEILEPFLTKWKSLNGELGYLKYPTSSGIRTANGLCQAFEGGKIFWSPSSNAISMSTPLASMYDDVGGHDALGFPIADEAPMQNPLGTIVRFQKGKILWNALLHPTYTFSVDGTQCSNSDSKSNETLVITATIAALGHDPVTVTENLGKRDDDGYRNSDLKITNIPLGDEEVAVFSYGIAKVNKDDAAVKTALERNIQSIAVQAAEIEGKVGRPVDSDIVEALRGMVGIVGSSEHEWVTAPALNMVTNMAISERIAALKNEIVGLIAATTTSIGGKELRERFSEERLYQRGDTALAEGPPGKVGSVAAESGDAGSEAYNTTWRITKSK